MLSELSIFFLFYTPLMVTVQAVRILLECILVVLNVLFTFIYNSRMRTARSLTVSRHILCMAPQKKPRMPPQKKPCMRPCPPRKTMHAPRKKPCMPPQKTMHPWKKPCMPPPGEQPHTPSPWSNHTHPTEQPCMPPKKNHACPLEQPHMPLEQPCMPPEKNMHAPPNHHTCPPSNHAPLGIEPRQPLIISSTLSCLH